MSASGSTSSHTGCMLEIGPAAPAASVAALALGSVVAAAATYASLLLDSEPLSITDSDMALSLLSSSLRKGSVNGDIRAKAD